MGLFINHWNKAAAVGYVGGRIRQVFILRSRGVAIGYGNEIQVLFLSYVMSPSTHPTSFLCRLPSSTIYIVHRLISTLFYSRFRRIGCVMTIGYPPKKVLRWLQSSILLSTPPIPCNHEAIFSHTSEPAQDVELKPRERLPRPSQRQKIPQNRSWTPNSRNLKFSVLVRDHECKSTGMESSVPAVTLRSDGRFPSQMFQKRPYKTITESITSRRIYFRTVLVRVWCSTWW